MALRKRTAFTLVEMLVVVVIISILAAMLLPAVMAARGRARVVTCTNNQAELGKAVLAYESAKNRFPGVVNQITVPSYVGVSGVSAVSWVPVLLPYIERNDLWEGVPNPTNPSNSIHGWRTGNPNVAVRDVRIKQVVCPDDDNSATGALTYVVHVGTGTAPPSLDPADATAGVFRNLVPLPQFPSSPIRPTPASNLRATSRRPMLSERHYPIGTTIANRSWNSSCGPTATIIAADLVGRNLTPSHLGFIWPGTTGTIVGDAVVLGPLHPEVPTPQDIPTPLLHAGIIVVTFCDGHTESISEDALCTEYDCQAIP